MLDNLFSALGRRGLGLNYERFGLSFSATPVNDLLSSSFLKKSNVS